MKNRFPKKCNHRWADITTKNGLFKREFLCIDCGKIKFIKIKPGQIFDYSHIEIIGNNF